MVYKVAEKGGEILTGLVERGRRSVSSLGRSVTVALGICMYIIPEQDSLSWGRKFYRPWLYLPSKKKIRYCKDPTPDIISTNLVHYPVNIDHRSSTFHTMNPHRLRSSHFSSTSNTSPIIKTHQAAQHTPRRSLPSPSSPHFLLQAYTVHSHQTSFSPVNAQYPYLKLVQKKRLKAIFERVVLNICLVGSESVDECGLFCSEVRRLRLAWIH